MNIGEIKRVRQWEPLPEDVPVEEPASPVPEVEPIEEPVPVGAP